MKNPYTNLARKTIEEYLSSGKTINLPDNCPSGLKDRQAGCFVSYHQGDELRGCIGTYRPTCDCLGQEIIACAIAACRDPRFSPLRLDELAKIKVKVDVLSPPEKTKVKDLDPKIYGLIVKSKDGRRGLLLPDLEGVESAKQQIEICREKAGIPPDESIELYRFRVERHEE